MGFIYYYLWKLECNAISMWLICIHNISWSFSWSYQWDHHKFTNEASLASQTKPTKCKVGWVVTLKRTRAHTRAPSRQVAKLNPLPMTIRLFCWYSPCASSLISESSSSASRIRSAWVAVVMIISFSDPPEIGKRVWCSEPTAHRMSWLHFTSRTQAFWWLWLLHCMVYKSLVRLCEASWESWEWAMKQMFSSSPKQIVYVMYT